MLTNSKLTAVVGISCGVLVGLVSVGASSEPNRTPPAPKRKVIGRWNHDRPYVESVVTIYRKNDKLFMEDKYRDGSSGRIELVEEPYSGGMKFKPKKTNDFGEYFVVDKRGNLQYWDRDGRFYTAKTMH